MFPLARFLPSVRSDASAKIGPKGDICGRSHISKSFDCHKGAGGDRTAPKNVSSLIDDLNKFKDGKLAVSDLPKSWADADLFDEPLSIKDYFEGTLSQEESDRARYDQYLTEEIHPKGSNKYIVDDGAGVPWLVQKSGDKWAAQPTGFTTQQADEYLKPFGEDADLVISSARNSRSAIAKEIALAKTRVNEWAAKSGVMGKSMYQAYQRQLKLEVAADNPGLRIYAQYNDPDRYDSHSDYGGTPEQFQSLQSSYKDVLRRYNFDSVLPRLDARQAPKTQGKTPGQPCGNGWISAGFKCDPEKAKTAGARLRNPENSAVKSRFVDRMRKAKGLGAGLRDKQLSDRVAKRIAEKAKEAIAQPTKSKPSEPKARHRTMAKSVTSIEGLTSRMKAFENMATSPSLNEKGRENASQIVQAFKEEIAAREIKLLKLVRGVAATQSAIKTKNPKTAQKAAELLREGVGSPDTPQQHEQGKTIKRGGSTLRKGRNGQHYSIDSSDLSDRADTGMGVRFAGRNTGILVDADSRSSAIAKARKKKKRGGDAVEEVWALTSAQKAQSDKGNWVRTVGKDERHLASEGRRGQGPKPKAYRVDTKLGTRGKK
jgi:hypothetical protein